jgi:AcrR family transcriptional regulator
VTEATADPRANEKRRRIVEAAWRLALRNGLRATTMEALAREAGVAKGTLYAHFPDKDAVFDGAVADLLVELAAAFDRGMRSEGAVAERVGASLAGKYGVIARAIEGSPHAGEILGAHHRFAPRVAAFDGRVESEVAAVLADAGAADAPTLARIVIGGGRRRARASRRRSDRTRDPPRLSAPDRAGYPVTSSAVRPVTTSPYSVVASTTMRCAPGARSAGRRALHRCELVSALTQAFFVASLRA